MVGPDAPFSTRPRRICVTGSPCSGKTTLARHLQLELQLPLINLDDIYWGVEWGRPHAQDWKRTVHSAAAGESWIIEGGYAETLEARVARSQLVILLDTPAWLCAWRYLHRVVRIKLGASQLLPSGVQVGIHAATPKGDLIPMLKKIFGYQRNIRPFVIETVDRHQITLHIVRWGSKK